MNANRCLMTSEYLFSHFKWSTTSSNQHLLVITKPVPKRLLTQMKKRQPTWVFHETSGVQYFTYPMTEEEIKLKKETGDPYTEALPVPKSRSHHAHSTTEHKA